MKQIIRAILSFIIGVGSVLGLIWLGGFDFFVRSPGLSFSLILAFLGGTIVLGIVEEQ